jgi:hypothetical protein
MHTAYYSEPGWLGMGRRQQPDKEGEHCKMVNFGEVVDRLPEDRPYSIARFYNFGQIIAY